MLTPAAAGQGLAIELRGNLAAMLGATVQTRGHQKRVTSYCEYRCLRGRDLKPEFRM